jgi:DNA-binding transcriptional ArsR family regulator
MPSDQLSVTFAALADPTRRAILARLSQGEASVTDLAKPFDLSLPGVSKHLKVLQRAGLITQSRNAQWRPCRLEGARLQEASEWVGEFRRFWDESFERIDEYLAELKKEKRSNDNQGRNRDGEN